MRRLVLLACVLVAGCAEPVEKAEVGQLVSRIHVRDLKTGKCVRLSMVGRSLEVVSEINCKPKEGK